MKKLIIALMIIIGTTTFGKLTPKQIDRDIERLFKIVSPIQELNVNGNIMEIDLKRLMRMTAMVESRFATNKYSGKIAKSAFQYEMATANHYVGIVGELKNYLETEIGREISLTNDNDCVYVTYLIYMSKLRHHRGWLDKYYTLFRETGDIEWLVYKVLWNSVKGATTYNKWQNRDMEMIDVCLKKVIQM